MEMTLEDFWATAMVNLGVEWRAVGEMTILEIKRSLKARLELKRHDYEMQWRIQLNVVANQNRKKSQKFIELFPKEEVSSTKKDEKQAEKERDELFK